VDEDQRPLKTGSKDVGVACLCGNNAASSKPEKGRGVADASQSESVCECVCCGGRNCKTCFHLVECSTFTSNVTGKTYNVRSQGMCMDCSTKNVIYLISCRKCGMQYVGETSQALRSRFNNHRNRLKRLCGQCLYQHF